MDVIASLAIQAAYRNTGMEKDAGWRDKLLAGVGKLFGGGKAAKVINAAAPAAAKAAKVTAPAAGNFLSTPGAIRAGQGAAALGAGYLGYGGVQAARTGMGAYHNPEATSLADAQNTGAWRQASRSGSAGQTAWDMMTDPGRTLMEGLGFGGEGPERAWSNKKADPVRNFVDPYTGKRHTVNVNTEESVWRPDLEAQRQEMAKKYNEFQQAHPGIMQGLDVQGVGQQAGRVSYPGARKPGAVNRNYDIYNYGL